MLYDPKWNEAQQLLDLNKPSLQALSYYLRHEELWPAGFIWRYNSCNSCAMGLAAALWTLTMSRSELEVSHSYKFMSDNFNITNSTVDNIFLGKGNWMPMYEDYPSFGNFYAVTPEMVADQIDKYLASR